ncbi:glycosyltransferase [Winogradskyella sp.]|uniref:glycosyltransferase n=1 Tax=Winogradskyella sp. TaxID=1883156 RepID=UPI002616F499|nr:glycosyltransferase [Winogradskyella sp.]
MKKLKVLHISETFAAGVYTYIKDICEFFDEIETVESYVIYSGIRKGTNRDKFSKDFSKNVTLIEVRMEREISPLKDFKSTYKLIKTIRKISPDVIHLHSSKAGVIGRVASKFYPMAKVYYTPNGYSFLREDVSPSKKKFFKIIEGITNKLFGGVTVACGDTEYEYAKTIGPALLVRNGVNIDEVYAHKLEKQINKGVFVVGTMGRLSPQKNPRLFNEIALLNPNIRFIWIGDGELRNEVSSKNIEVTGWRPREEALKSVNEFDIYLQTSLWEGLPFTIIEAMVLGKPIIANNVIGNKDAVENNYNGFLCNSIEEFVTAINKIQSNFDLKQEMSINSKTRANKLFDRDENFKILQQIYFDSSKS